jgi:hypothetical protein
MEHVASLSLELAAAKIIAGENDAAGFASPDEVLELMRPAMSIAS